MGKNRNNKGKRKNAGGAVAPMDISSPTTADAPDGPQAMDTSEGKSLIRSVAPIDRKIKKGVSVRRTKSVRKQKAIAKAIAKGEKIVEKASKKKKKLVRIQSAKTLYD